MRFKVMAAVSVLTLMTTLGAGTASADSTSDRNRGALARLADGTWSEADLALIRSQPAIAAQVMDPSRPPEVTTGSAPAQGPTTLAASCKSYWVNYSYYSALGSKIYTWQKYVTACYNGSAVTSISERYDWLPSYQSMIKVRERTVDSQSGTGTWQYNSRIARHLEYCVAKYGCYADTYPWAQFKIYGNGTWWYQGADS